MDSIPIEVTRKSIKRLNLRVYPPEGLVKVSAPLRFSEKLIRQHLQDKLPWIIAVRERLQKTKQPKDELLETGRSFEFRGVNYEIRIIEHNGPYKICLDDKFLHCYTQPSATQAQLSHQFERWLRKEMNSLLPDLFTKWQAIIGVKANEWGIKKMRTRWGSCNTRVGRIWLNLSLIQKPPVCLEYVLVHELVHLLEASHNSRFHALMTHFMPEWKHYKKVLEGKLETTGENSCV